MPALDKCHDQVVSAFRKEGWVDVKSPLVIDIEDRRAYIDVLFTRGTNGRRENLLVVEIKCFGDENTITTEIYTSLGQYQIYRLLLERARLNYPLFLAVPKHIFEQKFDRIVLEMLANARINVVIVDIEIEEIVQWMDYRKS
jgi:hypothetical protein